MSVKVKDKKTGKDVILLNPFERSKKYCREMKKGGLTPTQLAYRSGYLASLNESTRIWKKKNGIVG